jgi:hypothetical protein
MTSKSNFCKILKPSDPPDIDVEQSRIHTGEGREAILVCIVHADPPPAVRICKLPVHALLYISEIEKHSYSSRDRAFQSITSNNLALLVRLQNTLEN